MKKIILFMALVLFIVLSANAERVSIQPYRAIATADTILADSSQIDTFTIGAFNTTRPAIKPYRFQVNSHISSGAGTVHYQAIKEGRLFEITEDSLAFSISSGGVTVILYSAFDSMRVTTTATDTLLDVRHTVEEMEDR